MPAKVEFGDIGRYVGSKVERVEKAILYRLSYIGEEVVSIAKNLPSMNTKGMKRPIPPHQPNYIDWSGNLRNSIGYIIISNGVVVKRNGFENKEGSSFADSFVSKFKEGVALVVVAGMRYAFYVKEKGYDVLDSSEIAEEKLIRELVQELKEGYK